MSIEYRKKSRNNSLKQRLSTFETAALDEDDLESNRFINSLLNLVLGEKTILLYQVLLDNNF